MSTQATPSASENVDPEYEDVMGNAGNTYWPPDPCGAPPPEGQGEHCRLEAGHAGDHSDLWAVWER